MRSARPAVALAVALALVAAACSGDDGDTDATAAPSTTSAAPSTTTAAAPSTTGPGPAPTAAPSTTRPPAPLAVTDVATGLDTVWALAWDPDGNLWFTERGGRLTRLGSPPVEIDGVEERGEAGLMGLEIDGRGRRFLMYTAADENRVVRLEPDGRQTVLVDGIDAATNHDGGRLRFGPDGVLYASTGDALDPASAQDPRSLNGKILRVDTERGGATVFSRGHRNAQGLCFEPGGRFLSTEHGPDRGDEINVLREGLDGGWPRTTGNGIHNYTPTIAPAGCAVYDGDLIPQWRGSMLFVTLKGRSLHRLTFDGGGGVAAEEVLYDGEFGRLRDVRVGPDGAVYLATSNRDGRGSPRAGDDRILRVAPAGA